MPQASIWRYRELEYESYIEPRGPQLMSTNKNNIPWPLHQVIFEHVDAVLALSMILQFSKLEQ